MTITSLKESIVNELPTTEDEDALLFKYSTGEHDVALQIAQEWLMKYPAHHLGWKVAGYIYQTRNQLKLALSHLEQAVALGPQDASDLNNIGVMLTELGDLQEAQSHFERAVIVQPQYVKAWTNLAMVFQLKHEYTQAQSAAQQAVSLDETDAAALVQLGNAFEAQGLLSQAQASYYRADMAHEPRRAVAHSNVLYLLNHDVLVEPAHLFAEHLAFGEQFEKPLRAKWQGHGNTIDTNRTLKVGFVSGDFCHHALNEFLEPAFNALSTRTGLSLYAYATNTREDDVTHRMRKYFAHWCSVAELSDDALAQQIRSDAIDILIDLSGHTAKNRLLTFARKPAPVQMSWLGYLGTTGLTGMDYYLCDDYWIPKGKLDWQFTEKLAYLPSAAVFQPDPLAPPVNPLPALRNGHITFGSFNRVTKINESVVALWSMVMQKVPGSVLVLVGIEAASQPRITTQFSEQGIEASRLSFYPRLATADYLALHQQVDICLDTFPHGGGATTAHAAWMGVPTLCLAGETPASRFSATFMHHLGLAAFVATSIDEFVMQGAEWAAKTQTLASIRSKLRATLAQSKLGQTEDFGHSFEALLRRVWQIWCDTSSQAGCVTPTISASQNSATLAESLAQLAMANEACNDFAAAACLYQEILKIQPINACVSFRLGVLEFKLNGSAGALPHFEAAVQNNPNEEAHWVAYVETLILSGSIETAASAIEWGQKFGLSEKTAGEMASNCVNALERKANPEIAHRTSSYTDEQLALPAPPPWPDPKLSLTADLTYLQAPRSKGRRYIIFAPLYRHNSAGIRVCYELQKWLILAGYDALVIAGTNGYAKDQFEEDIVIYPEIVRGNPLKVKRVVRYILNHPGHIGGDMTYAQNELLVAYSPELTGYSGGAMLQLPATEAFFHKDDTPKIRNAVYVGKRQDLKTHPTDCVYVTGVFPNTRRAVADFLRTVDTLYTYDEFTILIHEAKTCGCNVRYIDSKGKIGDVLHCHFSPEDEFKPQLHDFIETTQRL